MRERLSSPDDQIKKYASVLLGDKDYERVMEAMAKVDKATKTSIAGSSTSTVSRSGGGGRFSNIQCFQCLAYGHVRSGQKDVSLHLREEGGHVIQLAELLVLGLLIYTCVIVME